MSVTSMTTEQPPYLGGSPAGQIAVAGRFGAPNGVIVQTLNAAGVPADLSFHLSVPS